jgi:hypothetical protein
MDPVHPIAPGPPAIPPATRVPVERLERITRERDRPSKDARERERERERRRSPAPQESEGGEDGDGPRHIDVRA